jgi:hypothetical protein
MIPTVVLEDLADPQFSPEVREMMAMAAALAPMLDLSVESICNQACAELGGGLSDFGGDGFRAPMTVLVDALNNEASLSGFGHVSLHTQLVQLAKNRLLLADLLHRHPEIHDIAIERPIIIAGQGRTGTTHLHNLLAADPNLRSLPYWESQQPVPIPAELGIDPDPRRARCEGGLQFLDQALPHFKRMHEMTVDHVHEEIQLLAMDYSTMLFETMAMLPSVRDYYLSHDQTPHYQYMRTVLQAMTFLRGGQRWVLKSPQHLEQFHALNNVFPDATVLITHRDPVSVTISMMTMLAYTQRFQAERVDLHAVGRYWTDRNSTMLKACIADRHLLPADRSLDVIFHRFMADDLATVRQIYDLADQPYTAATAAAQQAYLESHERDRHGKVAYDFTQFGIDPAEVRGAFPDYLDQYGVRPEWKAASTAS